MLERSAERQVEKKAPWGSGYGPMHHAGLGGSRWVGFGRRHGFGRWNSVLEVHPGVHPGGQCPPRVHQAWDKAGDKEGIVIRQYPGEYPLPDPLLPSAPN